MSSLTPIIAIDRSHLEVLIGQTIAAQGFQCNLNHIDVSGIEDFAALFTTCPQFNGDISKWNTSSAVSMNSMFKGCKFNGDISQWNTSKVTDMDYMFKGAKFNGNILGWDVSKVECMEGMFKGSDFNNDISKWNVGNVQILNSMFYNSVFNQNISQWNVGEVWDFSGMFKYGVFAHDISEWTVRKEALMSSFYKDNSLFLAAQRMEPWIVGLYLENADTPAIPEWQQAFANIQPLALSLGLTLAEHIAAIVEAHSFIVASANPTGHGDTAVDNAVFETDSSAA